MLPANHDTENKREEQDDDVVVLTARTRMGEDRISNTPFYKPPDEYSQYGYYQNHHIIGRNSRVSNGVYLGGGAREAIVVQNNEILDSCYAKLVQHIENAKPAKEQILELVYDEVRTIMPYDNQTVKKIISGRKKDNKILLSKFIHSGGICRHQALLATFFLERLIDDGLLTGRANIHRNQIVGRGSHAWAQYHDGGEQIYVIDPAQGYCSLLNKAPKTGWFYSPLSQNIDEENDMHMQEDHEAKPLWLEVREVGEPTVPENRQQAEIIKHHLKSGEVITFTTAKRLVLELGSSNNLVKIEKTTNNAEISYYTGAKPTIHSWPLPQIGLSFGSAPDNHFLIEKKRVAPHHCNIDVTDRGIVVRDLGSVKGITIMEYPQSQNPKLHELIGKNPYDLPGKIRRKMTTLLKSLFGGKQ